jgi:hypothetical protein
MKAQSGYYLLPSAKDVLENRIAVLREAIPKGSTILDIGCNDGSISNALIESGTVQRSYCFDLENILVHHRPELVFKTANLNSVDLSSFPDADGVLLLNVLHHVTGHSHDRAKQVIDHFLDRYGFIITDMGSFTEKGDWGWRKYYDRHWKSDGELWSFLFANAELRFKLLRYPTQGKGERTLWKLYKKAYEPKALTPIQTYRRTTGAWPTDKALIEAQSVSDKRVSQTVEFTLCRSDRGDKFWQKRYLHNRAGLFAGLEAQISALAKQEAAEIYDRRAIRTATPISVHGDTLLFCFEPDLFRGETVHFQDWTEFLSPDEVRTAAVLGARYVRLPAFKTKAMLLHLCDFQIMRGWDGLVALDFEPNQWVASACAGSLLGDDSGEKSETDAEPAEHKG